MKQLNYKPFIIFSVYTKQPDDFNNFLNHEYVKQKFFDAKIEFTETVGCYNGTQEKGFLISSEHRHAAEFLAKQYNQESILFRDRYGETFLEFLEPRSIEHIGQFKEVSEEVALKQDAWTMIDKGDKQLYYICEV